MPLTVPFTRGTLAAYAPSAPRVPVRSWLTLAGGQHMRCNSRYVWLVAAFLHAASAIMASPEYRRIRHVDGSRPDVHQPDYRQWSTITNGMRESQVVDALGQPVEQDDRPTATNMLYCWKYGWLITANDDAAFPDDMPFTVSFVNGVVLTKEDPFLGELSTNGIPTEPHPIIPLNDSSFDHYPRYLDLRWTPASGLYPMEYELQIDVIYPDGKIRTEKVMTTRPFYCHSFSGASKGRWRIKARNSRGESNWTQYRHFEFKH